MTMPELGSRERKTSVLVCGSTTTACEVPGLVSAALRVSVRAAGILGVGLTACEGGRSVGAAVAAAAKTGCARKSAALVTGLTVTPEITIAPYWQFRKHSQALCFLA